MCVALWKRVLLRTVEIMWLMPVWEWHGLGNSTEEIRINNSLKGILNVTHTSFELSGNEGFYFKTVAKWQKIFLSSFKTMKGP